MKAAQTWQRRSMSLKLEQLEQLRTSMNRDIASQARNTAHSSTTEKNLGRIHETLNFIRASARALGEMRQRKRKRRNVSSDQNIERKARHSSFPRGAGAY